MALDIVFSSAPAHPFGARARFSPLVLADRLLTLAQEADRAGYHDSAARLLGLMYETLDPGAEAQR